MSARELDRIHTDVVACRACPRLVAWREEVAREKVARFADQEYWGRPVPGFGDPAARVLILGLAPAAHGGNRTGRIFTGDRSGDFLYASLHRCGVANQPTSVARDDGLRLVGVYVTAVNRCAPPGNKPTPQERDTCLPFLEREIAALRELRVIVALGSFAWDGALRALAASAGHRCGRSPSSGTARRPDGGTALAARLLPPESAEHVHRQADGADARRRHPSGDVAGGSSVDLPAASGAPSAPGTAGARTPTSPT